MKSTSWQKEQKNCCVWEGQEGGGRNFSSGRGVMERQIDSKNPSLKQDLLNITDVLLNPPKIS